MEVLIIIGIVWAVIAFIRSLSKRSSGSTTSASQPLQDSSSTRMKRDPNVFRPSPSARSTARQRIQFKENGVGAGTPSDLDIKDIVDALTGAPLDLASGLYQCKRCRVFYQAHSFEVIQSENGGRCVSCLHAEVVSVTDRRERRGRNADVSVITLDNYRQYVGHVITFEGKVHIVLTSRRGTDYAVMFEDQTWTRGFKMVVFRGDVARIGGAQFVFSLVGHQVRVRGLLIQHKDFGFEIIVSDRAMILSVQ